MQEINLDWILTKIKNILRFVPDDGAVGQILRRTAHGAEWSDEQGAGGSVTSVNGMQGAVVLTYSDVGALPDTYSAPVDSVNGQTGTVVIGKSDIGLGNVDNVQQYSATNPPPYPVTSVNGQTGAVTLAIPDSTSDLINDSGFVNSAGAAAASPVQSVNGQTGAVVIDQNESGTTYLKFPDGTLIQWELYSIPSNGTRTITFPIAFISSPSVFGCWSFGTNGNVAGDIGALKIYNVSSTGVSFTIGGEVPASMIGILNAQIFAIGRWKN